MCSRTAQIELFFGFTAALSVSLSNFDLCGTNLTRTLGQHTTTREHAQFYVFIVLDELALFHSIHGDPRRGRV